MSVSAAFRAKKFYHLFSVALLGLIPAIIIHYGEGNLPPLMKPVRYEILALFANWFLSYILFVSDPAVESETPRGWLWMALIGTGLALIWPVFSGDINEYLIRGRMLAIYHISPYRAVPNDFPDDILRKYSVWASYYDSYGPLSVYLQTLAAMFFQKSVTGMIWVYKMIILGFYSLAVVYFWKIVQLVKPKNGARLWAMFAYCPLLVVIAMIDGHNDTVMMAFSILSLYFFLRKDYGRCFFFVTCGFLVKYMILLQLPFMMLFAVKDIWAREKKFPAGFIAKHLALNIGFVVLCFAPVWGGANSFLSIFLQKGAFYTNTVPFAVHQALQWIGLTTPTQIVKTFFIGLFCGVYAFLFFRSGRLQSVSTEFFRAVGFCYLMLYLCLPSPFCPWYLLWGSFWVILAQWPKSLLLLVLYSLVGVLSFYKRPNYLAIIAIFIYAAATLPGLLAARTARK